MRRMRSETDVAGQGYIVYVVVKAEYKNRYQYLDLTFNAQSHLPQLYLAPMNILARYWITGTSSPHLGSKGATFMSTNLLALLVFHF